MSQPALKKFHWNGFFARLHLSEYHQVEQPGLGLIVKYLLRVYRAMQIFFYSQPVLTKLCFALMALQSHCKCVYSDLGFEPKVLTINLWESLVSSLPDKWAEKGCFSTTKPNQAAGSSIQTQWPKNFRFTLKCPSIHLKLFSLKWWVLSGSICFRRIGGKQILATDQNFT